MKRALVQRFMESQTGEDLIDLDEIGDEMDAGMGISATLENAITDVSGGGSSVGKVMRNLKAHVQDSHAPVHPMARRLGRLSGKNHSRDFWRAFKDGPAIEYIRLPVKHTDLEDGVEKFQYEEWPIMDIHTIIAFLEKSGLQISQHSLREYWSHHQQVGETWAQHGEHDRIPLGIYGDSARCATTFGFINLIGIFCNVILWKPKAVKYSRFLVFAIPEQSLWRHHTLNVVYRRICWSLNCLYDGLHPHKGPYEEDLPAHLAALSGSNFANRYMVTEIRGDWQWHKKVWRFEKCSWIAVNMCHQCPAKSVSNNPRDLYWMFDDNSWEDCPFTTDQFIAERIPSRGICPLLGLKSFDPSCIRWCFMHVVHLGLLYTVNGSGLNLLLQGGYFGAEAGIALNVKLSRAYRSFKQFCSRNRIECSQPEFTSRMIYKTDGDIALTAKAYNGRVILEWLSETVYLACQDDTFVACDPRAFLIAAALRHMSRLIGQMEAAGRYLSERQATSIFQDGKSFLDVYLKLTRMSLQSEKFEWFVKPKLHALWHLLLPMRNKRTNVRMFNGFIDEDAMSWLKRTYFRAHPQRRARWILRCGKLRIWATHKKIKLFNRQVAERLRAKR